MVRLLTTLTLLTLTNICFSQNLPIEDFLNKADSLNVEFDKTNQSFIIRRIDVTPFSLIIDGKEMFVSPIQAYQNTDSSIGKLLRLNLGIITRIEKDSETEYFKVLKADSILSMRFASIGIPLTNEINIDSVYLKIKDKVSSGTAWNNLEYHFTEDDNPIRGTTGWLRSSEIFDEFRTTFNKHKIGDIFVVKNLELKYAWIVYKTDNESFFERKQILYATTQKF